jgi:hypothetical protein
VAKSVELQGVTLRAATLSTHLSPLKLPDTLDIQSRYSARGELHGTDTPRIYAYLDFEFEGRTTAQDAPENPALKLEATFLLAYSLKVGAEYPEGAISDFAHINGAYNAWPYWRELVQTVSGRVGLAGIIVPVFRAQDFETRFSGRIDRMDPPKPTAKPAAAPAPAAETNDAG